MAGEIRSFRHPVTNRLKAWGRMLANEPGDLVRVEPEDFNLDLLTGAWEFDGAAWVAVGQAVRDAEKLAAQRAAATAFLSSPESMLKLLRAVAAVLVDELNIARGWTVSFKAEVAAAASLADLKTRVATLPTLNDRTLAQAKTAILAKIGSGEVDT